MKARWLLPLLVFAGAAAGAWYATLLATPFVLMRAASAKVAAGAPVNGFAFGPMTTATNQTIVRPSPDLSYSLCRFEIPKDGHVRVDVEPVPGRYWSVSVYDARTDVAAVVSDRDTGGKAAKLVLYRRAAGGRALAGLDTSPQGYRPVAVDYDRGIVLIRILLATPAEFPAVDVLRRRSSCRAG